MYFEAKHHVYLLLLKIIHIPSEFHKLRQEIVVRHRELENLVEIEVVLLSHKTQRYSLEKSKEYDLAIHL